MCNIDNLFAFHDGCCLISTLSFGILTFTTVTKICTTGVMGVCVFCYCTFTKLLPEYYDKCNKLCNMFVLRILQFFFALINVDPTETHPSTSSMLTLAVNCYECTKSATCSGVKHLIKYNVYIQTNRRKCLEIHLCLRHSSPCVKMKP